MLVAQAFAEPRDYDSQQLLGLAEAAERYQRGCQTVAAPQRARVDRPQRPFLPGTDGAKLPLTLFVPSETAEDRPAQRVGDERAEVGALLAEAEDARPLVGAVDLGERLVVAAEALEDGRAQVAGAEGRGVRRAAVGALLDD